MNITKMKEAFPEISFPEDNGFFSRIDQWNDIYEGNPPWLVTKKAGLMSSGTRRKNSVRTAKLLCDEFSRECFAEQVDITCGNDTYDEFIRTFLDREGFWKNFPHLLSKAFAQGGCCLREYIDKGTVKLSYVTGQCFYPVAWDNRRITDGIFATVSARGGFFYTLYERHFMQDGEFFCESRLFRSDSSADTGSRVPLSEIGLDDTIYGFSFPSFQYFRTDISNNQQTDLPLGISLYANCTDTLSAIDTIFDSLIREYILGRKRIIVPSSCIRTVVDTETGEVRRFFDTDDEVYQALKCDEEKDLKITDNTVNLRIGEHVEGINALLNILCTQVGLTPGALSFDGSRAQKTATEIISENSETARTIKANKNLLTELIEGMLHSVIELAVYSGELPKAAYQLSVAFRDSVIIDDNTLIDNNVKLVSVGLKSRLSAMMDVLKCDEQTAKKELERITAENEPGMVGDEE